MSKNKDYVIEKLLKKAKDRVSKMSPEEYAAMMEAQKALFVRGMMVKCEHGVLDFEQCPECRSKYSANKEA
jgi:hypothetical protein